MKRFTTINIDKFSTLKNEYLDNSDLEKAASMTAYVDALLFKATSLQDIVNKVEVARATKFHSNKDFKTVKRIQSHLNYRINHDHMKVNVSKQNKVRYVNIDND